ncbi:MAG: lytic transglycosylase domain-containing protein, partial [Actinomycetota bacterium]
DLAPPYPLANGQALAIPSGVEASVEPLPGIIGLAAPLGPSIERWAEEYRLPPALLKAVTWRESLWRADAVSSRGAIGVGQILPETAGWVSDHLIGRSLDPWQVEENLQLSAAYLRWLIDRTGGDEAAALAAYHQGRTSVAEEGWFTVTHRYVRDVFDLRWRFEASVRPSVQPG